MAANQNRPCGLSGSARRLCDLPDFYRRSLGYCSVSNHS